MCLFRQQIQTGCFKPDKQGVNRIQITQQPHNLGSVHRLNFGLPGGQEPQKLPQLIGRVSLCRLQIIQLRHL